MNSWNLDEPPLPDDAVQVRLVLVRHGESEWNAQGRIQGHHGGGLTATGVEQATLAAKYLARAYPMPSLVISSDLARASETAAIVLDHIDGDVPLRLDPRLREVDNGSWSGQLTSTVATAEAAYIRRIRYGEDLRRGGGESLGDAQQRIHDWARDLAAELAEQPDPQERWALVFGHGGTIRLLALAALNLPGTATQQLGHGANTAISVIEYWVRAGTGRIHASRLLEYNSAQHLRVRTAGAAVLPMATAPTD